MKNNKFNILLLATLSLLLWVACNKNDDLELIEASHRVIFTSEMDFENKVNVDEEIAFGDVSSGVASRLWTFPPNVVDIIDSDNDQTSTEATVRAIFSEVGQFEVKLSQEFKKSPFTEDGQVGGTTLDTTLIVTVLGPVEISLKAEALDIDGNVEGELTLADDAENEVSASRTVRFTPTITGEPLNYRFEFEGGDPEVVEGPQEFIDVKYARLGSYGINISTGRARPLGEADTSFTKLIKVIPSTDPVTLDRVTEKDGKIAIVYSREIDASTLVPSDFSVSIKNLWNTFTPDVVSADLDPEAGNIILLTLDNESVYNDDETLITYTPGDITSSDGIKADAFTDAELVFDLVNILKDSEFDFSFENSTVDNWVDQGWGAPYDSYSFNFTGDQAFDGSKSLFVEFNANGGMIIANRDANGEPINFPVVKGGDYELGLWVYVTEIGNNPPMALAPDIRIYWEPETDWGIGPNPVIDAEFPIGQWIYSSAFVKFNDSVASFMIRGFNSANPEPVKAYIDNVILAPIRLRP